MTLGVEKKFFNIGIKSPSKGGMHHNNTPPGYNQTQLNHKWLHRVSSQPLDVSPCIRTDWRRLALGWRCIPHLDKHKKKESQDCENSHEYFVDAIHTKVWTTHLCFKYLGIPLSFRTKQNSQKNNRTA